MKNGIYIWIFLVFTVEILNAQKKEVQEIEREQFPIVGLSFGYVIPKGDMGDMYKPFLQTTVNGVYKFKTNWIVGIDGNFNFGSNNLRANHKRSILEGIENSKGLVVSSELVTQGKVLPVDVDGGILASNQGFSILAKVGRIFPVIKSNPNSGIFLTLGIGMVQSKILYESAFGVVDQLVGDYAKGYDRKMRGVQFSQVIGYWFMSNQTQYVNFYIGIECSQGISKSVRKYQFDLMGPDTKKYVDQMYTIKFGWMIPLGGKASTDFFYN